MQNEVLFKWEECVTVIPPPAKIKRKKKKNQGLSAQEHMVKNVQIETDGTKKKNHNCSKIIIFVSILFIFLRPDLEIFLWNKEEQKVYL